LNIVVFPQFGLPASANFSAIGSSICFDPSGSGAWTS
jgi:hypothetical protein